MKKTAVKKLLDFLSGFLITAGAFSVLTTIILVILHLIRPDYGYLSSWEDFLGYFFSMFSLLGWISLFGGYLNMSQGIKSVIKLVIITSVTFLIIFISIGSCMSTAY
jgi:hypothetical protein